MWLHSITVGLGGTAVSVGSDDGSLIDELEPWRVDVDRAVVDLGFEAFPKQPTERSAPRVLPNIRHGSERVVKSADPEVLRRVLRRMLAAHENAPSSGALRISGMALERKGRAVVVPLGNASLVAQREFERFGFDPIWAQSVLIDIAACEVLIDPPLGSAEDSRRLPLDTVWLSHREPDQHTPLHAVVARVLGNCRASVSLDDAMALVQSATVRFVAPGRDALIRELTAP